MDVLEYLLISLGITLLIALLLKYFISDRYKIPAVTLYIIFGVIMGISLLKVFTDKTLSDLNFVSKIALGIIAFTIGSELDKNTLAKLGKSILIIAFFESFGAFIVVTGSLILFTNYPFYYALILGAVSSATAPAATVYVIRQYKAKGPLTSTIMGVVGVDDAAALIIFVFASVFASSFMKGTNPSIIVIIFKPIIIIAISVLLGFLSGFVYNLIFRKIRDNEIIIMGIFAFLLIQLGISEKFDLSELLAIMSFGLYLANTNNNLTYRSKLNLDNISPILLPLFFILAGAQLNIKLIGKIGLIGLLYTAARMTGKILGASFGAVIGKAQKVVKKFVGFALIPQVGVAVALALTVKSKYGTGAYGQTGIDLSNIVINILLFTTIITETIGPFLTKTALTMAGEIEENKSS